MGQPRTLGQELLFWGGSVVLVGLCALRWAGPSLLLPVLLAGVATLAVTLIRHWIARHRS